MNRTIFFHFSLKKKDFFRISLVLERKKIEAQLHSCPLLTKYYFLIND